MFKFVIAMSKCVVILYKLVKFKSNNIYVIDILNDNNIMLFKVHCIQFRQYIVFIKVKELF